MRTKRAAGYRQVPNKDKKRRCELCVNFREGNTVNTCTEVIGGIERDGTCGRFAARRRRGIPGVIPPGTP